MSDRENVNVQPSKVQINYAPKDELKKLPGVGDVVADRLIFIRETVGNLGLEEIKHVKNLKVTEKLIGLIDFTENPQFPILKQQGDQNEDKSDRTHSQANQKEGEGEQKSPDENQAADMEYARGDQEFIRSLLDVDALIKDMNGRVSPHKGRDLGTRSKYKDAKPLNKQKLRPTQRYYQESDPGSESDDDYGYDQYGGMSSHRGLSSRYRRDADYSPDRDFRKNPSRYRRDVGYSPDRDHYRDYNRGPSSRGYRDAEYYSDRRGMGMGMEMIPPPFVNPYMNPYMMNPYMMNPWMMGPSGPFAGPPSRGRKAKGKMGAPRGIKKEMPYDDDEDQDEYTHHEPSRRETPRHRRRENRNRTPTPNAAPNRRRETNRRFVDHSDSDDDQSDNNGDDDFRQNRPQRDNVPKSLQYDGKDNWAAFDVKFRRYAEVHHWTPRNCKDQLCFCLKGKASEFFATLVKRDADLTFEELMQKLQKRFGIKEIPETARVKFNSLKQTQDESVEDWADRVLQLAIHAFPDLPDEYVNSQVIQRICHGAYDRDAGQFAVNQPQVSIEETLDKIKSFQYNHKAIFERSKAVKEVKTVHTSSDSDAESDTSPVRVRQTARGDSRKVKSKNTGRAGTSGYVNYKEKLELLEKEMSSLRSDIKGMFVKMDQYMRRSPERRSTYRSPSPNRQNKQGCYSCGSSTHFKKDCPGLFGQNKSAPGPGPGKKQVTFQERSQSPNSEGSSDRA